MRLASPLGAPGLAACLCALPTPVAACGRPSWKRRLISFRPDCECRDAMDSAAALETFRGLVLRHRGRTGLTQREFAERVGVHRRSLQEWEAGVTYPTPERLQAFIAALLDA